MSDQFKVGDSGRQGLAQEKQMGRRVHGVAGLWLWVDRHDGRQPMTILADEMTTVDPNKKEREPPLGVSPRHLWEEAHPNPTMKEIAARRQEVLEAIVRYDVAGVDRCERWIDEVDDLTPLSVEWLMEAGLYFKGSPGSELAGQFVKCIHGDVLLSFMHSGGIRFAGVIIDKANVRTVGDAKKFCRLLGIKRNNE